MPHCNAPKPRGTTLLANVLANAARTQSPAVIAAALSLCVRVRCPVTDQVMYVPLHSLRPHHVRAD